MEDLLQSQIRDSCRLALPEGLKDLMADISREVLRAQPQNLYQFIAGYLSVLLVAREHLFVASSVCDDLCKDQCWRDLEDELRELSLSEEDVKETLKVVAMYFSSDEVNEGNLLQKLTQKTNIEQKELPAVQDAIRCAFLRQRLGSMAADESPSADSGLDEMTIAAKHTLKIYQDATEDTDINYDCVASKIQAAYRAYNVRRKREQPQIQLRKSNDKVRFIDKQPKLTADLLKKCASKCSSMSLAGSFVALPLYDPYSVARRPEHHDHEIDDVDVKERERINIDYVADADAREQQGFNDVEKKSSKKTISFHNLPQVVEVDYYHEVEDVADEADYESEEIEEDIIDLIEEKMIKVSSNLDEQQDNGDDLAKTDSLVLSELDDVSDLSESTLEENNDGRNLEQSELERDSKMTLTQLAHDVQAHVRQGLSIAQVNLDSITVNSDEGDEQYKSTSIEIMPDDDMTLDLLRAVSDEIEEITKNQINEEDNV